MWDGQQGDHVEEQQQTAPGWHPDREQPAVLRWWDGKQWTDRRVTPVLIPEMQQIRDDVRFIRTVVLWWVILTVIGIGMMILGMI